MRRLPFCVLLAATAVLLLSPVLPAAQPDIVLYASDVTAMHGNWVRATSAGSPGGQAMSSADYGWSTTTAPVAAPNDYFEATFTAAANTPYHVWLRMRAVGDSKWNDSVWVQFGDAVDGQNAAVYRIGTTSGLDVNLENCSGCGVSLWGWQDNAWWAGQSAIVQFPVTGSHTIRVQTREDGVQIDQIVLSPATYFCAAPGQLMGDTTIVPKTTTAAALSAPSSSTPSSAPYTGSPSAIPGTIQAEDFDNGGEAVAYHDTTPGNSGGAYRTTDVDLQPASGGGYDAGWVSAGEWLNYTVNVAIAGVYTVQFRVASLGAGGTFHLEMNGKNVTGTMSVPNTGGWQNWQATSQTVTLAAGRQVARLVMDTAGASAVGNFDSMTFTAGAASAPAPAPPPASGSGVPVLEWNLNIGNQSDACARRQMDFIATLSPLPRILVLEEASKSLYSSYVSELQAKTGATWSGVFQGHCALNSWNGSSCTSVNDEGVMILTTYPIVSHDTNLWPFADCWHSARAAVHAAINVNGVVVQVFGTHLQTGGCTDVVQARLNSVSMLKTWVSHFPNPAIVSGDFNQVPSGSEICDKTIGVTSAFSDTWAAAGSGTGFTYPVPSVSMKIDYWFADLSGKAKATSTAVVTSPSLSDHYPLGATFVFQP
jgi:endonuclease/exonuclease/phosphatase family metal-dependent hydrolase